jgi:DNA-binding CsgD family transcriptional regulator
MDNKLSYEELEKKVAKLERELEKSSDVQKRFLGFLDNLRCEAFIKDRNHEFVFMNEYMRDIYERNEWLGKSVHEIMPKKFGSNVLEEDESVLNGATVDATRVLKDKWGKKRTYRVIKFPFCYDGNNNMIGGIVYDRTAQADAEEALKKANDELEKRVLERTKELNEANEALKTSKEMLAETNRALRILLKKREDESVQIEEKILYNVKELVKPYIEKLKTTEITHKPMALLNVVESNIDSIISPFVRDISLRFAKLTPMEIQVANLIKQGRTTKQIAELMNLSGRTIETHRKKIRNKIGIGNKKANLRSHLLSLQ